VPDEKWGEALKAIVQLKPGVVFDARDLDGYCRRLLSNYKVPKTFEYRDDLPRSPAGKILKRVLREPYWAGSARKVG